MRLTANFNKDRNNKIAFEGVKQELNRKNEPVYRFTPPAYDSASENAYLEIYYLEKDKKTGKFEEINEDTPSERIKFPEPVVTYKTYKTIDIRQQDIKDGFDGFAYRYVIVPLDESGDETGEERYITDSYRKLDFNQSAPLNFIADSPAFNVMPKAGTMLDVFKDSGAIFKDGKVTDDNLWFYRNHFTKLGGSVKGLLWLLRNTNELYPYRYVKTTPDMGVDKTSSHGYWPNNIYQSEDKETLNEFIFELFKKGKGYVADGAYTSQSVQSPLVQHVLKYGDKSPFYHMLKVEDNLTLAILPADKENMSHIGVKVVNNPQAEGYDKNKPTYIQFYDDRLASNKLQNDSVRLIESYDKFPKDHYEIGSDRDSVQPFYFELNLENERDVAKLDVFKTQDGKTKTNLLLNDIVNLDSFLKFQHYEIGDKLSATGGTFWDGNNDIIKMNLTNPFNDSSSTLGCYKARRYVINAARYWTENTQANLILNLAKLKPASNSAEIKNIVSANDITKDEYEYLLDEDNENRIKSLVVNPDGFAYKTTRDYVEQFPLQTIETSPELSAIFAQEEISDDFIKSGTFDKLEKYVDDIVDSSIPQEYRRDINKYEKYKAYVNKAYAPLIIQTLIVAGLNPKAVDENCNIDKKEAKNITLKSLLKRYTVDPLDERRQVAKSIDNALNDVDKIKVRLKHKIQNELSNISLRDFILSEALVVKSKAGLNWRFDAAKDIADLDAERMGKSTYDKVWNGSLGAQKFWQDMVGGIREINPSSYVINEITSLWEFFNQDDVELAENFDPKLYKLYGAGAALPDLKEREFIDETSSTTSSNYSNFFNKLSNFIGCDPEFGDPNCFKNLGNIGMLKYALETMNNMQKPNTATMSHIFWENYDKPRILHMMPLDQELFYANEDLDDFAKDEKRADKIAQITGNSKDYNNMSSKAIAVAIAMKETIEKNYDGEKKEKLIEALKELALGKKDSNAPINKKRAERFGALPYELTIKDIFDRAKVDYKENELDEFCYSMLGPSMDLEQRLWQVTCAMGGTPTVYTGMEYGQTGYEDSSKNPFQANRGQTLRHRRHLPGFEQFADKLDAISSMYLDRQLSAMREGTIVSCEIQTKDALAKGEQAREALGDLQLWPIYKYDDRASQVLTITSNLDVQKGVKGEKIVDSIPIYSKDLAQHDHMHSCPIDLGTEFVRKVYDARAKKYVDENEGIIYRIKEDTKIDDKTKKIVGAGTYSLCAFKRNKDGKEEKVDIKLNDTTTTFYVKSQRIENNRIPDVDYNTYLYSKFGK